MSPEGTEPPAVAPDIHASDGLVPVNLNSSDGVPVIVDGLLCSMVKAISRFPNDCEFVSIVETAIVETEIK